MSWSVLENRPPTVLLSPVFFFNCLGNPPRTGTLFPRVLLKQQLRTKTTISYHIKTMPFEWQLLLNWDRVWYVSIIIIVINIFCYSCFGFILAFETITQWFCLKCWTLLFVYERLSKWHIWGKKGLNSTCGTNGYFPPPPADLISGTPLSSSLRRFTGTVPTHVLQATTPPHSQWRKAADDFILCWWLVFVYLFFWVFYSFWTYLNTFLLHFSFIFLQDVCLSGRTFRYV